MVIPNLCYRDAMTAIEWLCKAFGFRKHAVYPGRDGMIDHAQLTYGTGMIMLSSVQDGPLSEYFAHPGEFGGRETQISYVVVANPKSHYEHAVKAGAEIILPLEEKSYGGSGYVCRDFEGYIWSFGDYDPWKT